MNDKQKIKIIAEKLALYLQDWKSKTENLNSFYYLSLANLRVYEDYLKDISLDDNEQEMIKEALQFKNVKFGEHIYKF
jgi:hypothetical protein